MISADWVSAGFASDAETRVASIGVMVLGSGLLKSAPLASRPLAVAAAVAWMVASFVAAAVPATVARVPYCSDGPIFAKVSAFSDRYLAIAVWRALTTPLL